MNESSQENNPLQPSNAGFQGNNATIREQVHPDGMKRWIRLEHEVTQLAEVRQRLLLHYAVRAISECQLAVESMPIVEARLTLAKMEGKSKAHNGEPKPTNPIH